MAHKIDLKITLGEFASDTNFDKEVDELLNKLNIEAENRFTYEKKKLSSQIEFDINSDTSYLKNNFILQFEQLIINKDEHTQIYLEKNINFKYKLEGLQTGPKNGTWQEFRKYID